MRGDNAYVVLWSGEGTGDIGGVFAQLYVNEAPVVDLAGTALVYTEGDGAVAIDGSLTVTDADDEVLAGATVSISGGYVVGEDELGFVDQLGISGDWDALTGVLTLTGVASVSNWEAALRTVTYDNVSVAPSVGQRTVTFVVDDGQDTGADARSINVGSVNDAPVVNLSGTSLTYTEGDGAVSIDGSLTLTDADDGMLVGATVAITAWYVAGEDVLAFVNQLGISGAWNPLTGVLTLSGDASVGEYQTALRADK
jgi:hypothetical protein